MKQPERDWIQKCLDLYADKYAGHPRILAEVCLRAGMKYGVHKHFRLLPTDIAEHLSCVADTEWHSFDDKMWVRKNEDYSKADNGLYVRCKACGERVGVGQRVLSFQWRPSPDHSENGIPCSMHLNGDDCNQDNMGEDQVRIKTDPFEVSQENNHMTCAADCFKTGLDVGSNIARETE